MKKQELFVHVFVVWQRRPSLSPILISYLRGGASDHSAAED